MAFIWQGAPCATCGKEVDAHRAPALRFSRVAQYVFCSREHAEAFPFSEVSAVEVPAPQSFEVPPSSHSGSDWLRARETHELVDEPAESARPLEELIARYPLNESGAPVPRPRHRQGFEKIFLGAEVALATFALIPSYFEGESLWTPAILSLVIAALGTFELRYVAARQKPLEKLRVTLRPKLEVFARRLGQSVEPRSEDERAPQSRRSSSAEFSREVQLVTASELRTGEEVIVGPGEYIPVDGNVVFGEALIEPWALSGETLSVTNGERVFAGARLVRGALRVSAGRTGSERALELLVDQLAEAQQLATFPCEITRKTAYRWGPALALVSAISVYFWSGRVSLTLLSLAALLFGFTAPLASALPSFLTKRKLGSLAFRGIVFPSARLLDSLGQTSMAVLMSRGTVLHGAPEVAEAVTWADATEEHLLSLAAGAESVVAHPIAQAILRAAERRGVVAESCRNHHPVPGMGVICVNAKGAPLIVGSRELLLRERLGIAVLEDKLRALEGQGLQTLLVAEEDRLVGIIALLDALRPGARAMVQLLLDANVEPVLLSGDARDTTEALAHTLAIDHVRPEVPAAERASEVRRLGEAGAHVTVVGQSGLDDGALGAADIAIPLGNVSAQLREKSVILQNEAPLLAGTAIAEARELRHACLTGLMIARLPMLVTAGGLTATLISPLFVPVIASLSAFAAVVTLERKRSAAEDFS